MMYKIKFRNSNFRAKYKVTVLQVIVAYKKRPLHVILRYHVKMNLQKCAQKLFSTYTWFPFMVSTFKSRTHLVKNYSKPSSKNNLFHFQHLVTWLAQKQIVF